MDRFPVLNLVAVLALSSLLSPSPAAADELPAPLRLSRGEAIQRALAQNPSLEAASEQVEEAKARVSEAKALPDPTFEATLEQQKNLVSPQTATAQDVGFGLTLPFPTKLKLGGDVARSGVRTTELTLTQLRQALAAQTAEAYDALLVAERHRDDLTQAKALALEFLSKTEARFKAGSVAKLDVLKAKVDVSQAENDLIANGRALATAAATLNRALGRAPGAPLEATDPLEAPPPLPALEGLLGIAASARPEGQIVSEQRNGAHLASRLARQYWLPDLSVTLYRNYTAGSPAAYSSAFSATLPLFFWWHQNGQVAEAKHRELELQATQRDVLAQVELDVRTAYAAADTALRQAVYLRDELLPEAQEAYRVVSVSYGLGGASALDLLDAKRALLDAESQLADALGAANDARADLERALGAPIPPASQGGSDAR